MALLLNIGSGIELSDTALILSIIATILVLTGATCLALSWVNREFQRGASSAVPWSVIASLVLTVIVGAIQLSGGGDLEFTILTACFFQPVNTLLFLLVGMTVSQLCAAMPVEVGSGQTRI
jgi:hypothetical protein